MEDKEDQTAPISEREVTEAVQSNCHKIKAHVVSKLLKSLNEKRDAYNGVVSSIIYIIDSDDEILLRKLKEGLIESITCRQMRFAGKMFLKKALIRLVKERPIFTLDFFEEIILTTSNWSQNFEEEGDVLRIQMIAMKVIRQAEQSRGGRPTQLCQEKIDRLCIDAIYSCDDSTKIDTLSLILESRSTTKPLDEKELSLFKAFYKDALNLQEPALRQIFLALTNKTIKRLKDSHKVVIRDTKRYSAEQRELITSNYMEFLTWLVEFCLSSIYCNAYFGSFIITMSTLKLIIQHVTFDYQYLVIEPLFKSRRCYDSILSCLNDSFEENKKLALDLLLSLPYNDKFFCEDNLVCFDKIAYQLVGSVNPAHSLTCQFIFKLIIGLRAKQAGSTASRNQLLLRHLQRLVDMVEEGINETNENFVDALKQKPIYPKLSCIRALLDEINIQDIESNRDEWKNLAKRIVQSSIEACKAVSAIVCNLNPETIGHLPMDLKPVDADSLAKTLKVSLKITNSQLNTITSQMLLICGWKTIKECSLSLGSMCSRFWWPREQVESKKGKFPVTETDPILDSDDIVDILAFFDHYLRNLRHRGAFEQAYNGFMMVTRRVWLDEHYRSLLVKTLHQIMNDFKNDDMDSEKREYLKAYVTRRSAGLPFIVQAILNSEHKHDSKTLRWVMDCLFEVLESNNSETYQRIHCLNILKALVKEHFLAEKVLSYIGKTFIITLDSFRSDSFPIRNCANMLLKATVDRTFGVNRLRDDIHRRNQLSFERFFSECPGLHSKMLGHLKDGLRDRKCLAAVHGVFIILFRLRTSLNPSENFDIDKIVNPFIELTQRLACECPDYKLRELASKLTIRLSNFCHERCSSNRDNQQDFNDYKISLEYLKTSISRGLNGCDQNRLHGSLLLLKNRVESDNLNFEKDSDRLRSHPEAYEIINQLAGLSANMSCSLKAVLLDLAESCCICDVSGDKSWLRPLHQLFNSDLLEQDETSDINFESVVFKYVTLMSLNSVLDMKQQPTHGEPTFHPEESKDETSSGMTEIYLPHYMISHILPKIVARSPDRAISSNLQASLVRYLRQLLDGSEMDSVDKILEKLDLDFTAAHMTCFDRLKLKIENDTEREIMAKYCQVDALRNYLKQSNEVKRGIKLILDLSQYKEFSPMSSEDKLSIKKQKFLAKFSNTPLSIELLAFAYKFWDEFDVENNLPGNTRIDRLNYFSQYLTCLPDCDVKCVALLCAGKMLTVLLRHNLTSEDQQPAIGTSDRVVSNEMVEALNWFSKVLDECADGDHSLTVREACAEVLRINLKVILQSQTFNRCKNLQDCLVNLLSALIKLSQDEDPEIRQSSQQVMTSLRDRSTVDYNINEFDVGSRLDYLIKLIATKLFNPYDTNEANNCFELLTRIIFNHSKNYSNDVNEEKERLFDKTILNAFADHVATIERALNGLQLFFYRRQDRSELFNLSSLRLPEDIVQELIIIDSCTDDNTGDYSWRLKKVIDGLPDSNQLTAVASEQEFPYNNQQVVDLFLENVLLSLSYFSSGYWNMLMDTEYTYHELSLYKRLAFVKFILHCTKYELKNEHLVPEIQKRLNIIVNSSCSTTMLCKCLNLISD